MTKDNSANRSTKLNCTSTPIDVQNSECNILKSFVSEFFGAFLVITYVVNTVKNEARKKDITKLKIYKKLRVWLPEPQVDESVEKALPLRT